jgi:hypothetical protein
MNKELKIIQDFYDFMLWMIKHIEKYPRHHRYSLGRDMESGMQTILKLLLNAKFRKNKKDILDEANIALEVIRFQLRISRDLQILAVKSYGYGSKCLLEIGSQLGGWVKSI